MCSLTVTSMLHVLPSFVVVQLFTCAELWSST